jgi:hypothetical protein
MPDRPIPRSFGALCGETFDQGGGGYARLIRGGKKGGKKSKKS